MRVIRVYSDSPLLEGGELPLDAEASHYLGAVLRLKPADAVRLFNEHNGEFEGVIVSVARKQVVVRLGQRVAAVEQPRLFVHLLLGLSKGERMDYALQKSTELGVNRITPVSCEFGEVRLKQPARLDNKMRHWQRVIVSACEQSGRVGKPHLDAPVAYDDALTLSAGLDAGEPGESVKLILDPLGDHRLEADRATDRIVLCVGPEGGFSDAELNSATTNSFLRTRLGPRILRTETAPVVALALVQHLYGDL